MELLLGIAVGAVFVIGAATVIVPALRINSQAGNIQEQAQLGQELSNNVQAWAQGSWNGVLALATGTANRYYLDTATSPFVAVGTSTTGEAVSTCGGAGSSTQQACFTYDRYFYLSDVYRDANGNATSTASGNYYDPSTKLVTVVVAGTGASSTQPMDFYSYITRNADNVFAQTSWIGGSGQTTSTNFVGTDYAAASSVIVNASGSIELYYGGGSCVL